MVLSKNLKFAICFGLIIGAILSLCNLCFADEGNLLSGFSAFGGALHETSVSSVVYYYPTIPGHTYLIKKTSSWVQEYGSIFFSLSISNGSPTTLLTDFYNMSQYTFVAPEEGYILISSASDFSTNEVDFSDVTNNMNKTVEDIANSIGIEDLSNVWNYTIPIVAIGVLVALGFYLVKRLINRIKRAKGGA